MGIWDWSSAVCSSDLHSRWAGLRSFVSDRSPVAGFAPDASGFFWLAGQGGYGIQTAPALSRFAAAQLLGRPIPTDLADLGVEAKSLCVARLQRGTAVIHPCTRMNRDRKTLVMGKRG